MSSERNDNYTINMKEEELTRLIVGDPKSIIEIGNVKVYVNRKFSWFQRKMLNLIFGFEVTNINFKGDNK